MRDGRNSDIKRWLMRAYMAEREIDRLLLEMRRVHSLRTRITSVMRETTSGGIMGDSRVDATVSLIEIEQRLEAAISAYRRAYDDVECIVGRVDRPKQREVLSMRYLTGMSFEQIAEHLGRDVRAVFRLHGRALETVRRIKKGTEDD